MAERKLPIEQVSPGMILGQDIKDPKTGANVYSAGARLSAEMINNILTMDFLELTVTDQPVAPSADRLPSKAYKTGDYIFFQGEPANHIYILKNGTLQVVATEINPPYEDPEKAKRFVNENGKVITVIKGRNVKFGEMAAVLSGLRSASIKCLNDAEVIEISTNESSFKQTILINPKLGISLTGSLAQRIKSVRQSVSDINKLYGQLVQKIQTYRLAFEKISASLNNKAASSNLEWLNRAVAELKNIPPLSGGEVYKPSEVTRRPSDLELKEELLPPEMEQYLQINTYLCKKGEKQEAFFILKKGKLEIIEHDQRVGTVGKPGELIHFLDPLLNPKGFSGTFSNTLLCISPVRLYKIPIAGIEELCCHHPRLILFICKWLAHHILIENDYLLHIQEVLEKDLARLAIGDTNYRRAYKKVSRLLEKFSKDPVVTKNEMTLADGLVDAIDRDYSNFREQIGKIHIASLQSA